MSIRVVVFDFGNVLAYFSRKRAAEQLAAYGPPNLSVEDVSRFVFFTDLEPAFESGRLTVKEVLNRLREGLQLIGTDEQLATACADMFTPNQAVCALIPRLQNRYRLALLSNTNELHYRQFRSQFADVLDRFDKLFVSHEMGVRKPDPAIYYQVQQWAAVEARECLFIDDLTENVAGAEACGWQGHVYRDGEDLAAELEVLGIRV